MQVIIHVIMQVIMPVIMQFITQVIAGHDIYMLMHVIIQGNYACLQPGRYIGQYAGYYTSHHLETRFQFPSDLYYYF